nr:hypothetical protein [Tanacetum cinerariifolium]
EVNAGDTAEGYVSAAHGEVPTVAKEPSIPSPTPPTPPPQPSYDIPSTSQVQPTPPQLPQVQPQSPQPQPQPQQDAGIPMNLLQEVMDTYTALTRRVEHLEFDKVAQALEITKLKRRVKKLERTNKVKVLKLRRLQKVGTTQKVETYDETVKDDVSNQGRMIAEMDPDSNVVLEDDKEEAKEEDKSEPAEVQEVVEVVTTAKIITEVVTAASETITAASTTITAAEVQVPAATLTDDAVVLKDNKYVAYVVKNVEKAKLIKEVVTAASETVTTISAIITTAEAQVPAATTATLIVAPIRVTNRKRKETKEQIEDDENRALLSTTFKPKEPTFQVALDVLSLIPFYQAFLISASVPATYMHEFWAIVSFHKHCIKFKMNKKNYSFDLETFRDMLQIFPNLPGQKFIYPPFEEEILAFIKKLGYSGNMKSLSNAKVETLPQP